MNVSSVKNLNGETFSAVQDAELTEVVQTNSGNWQDITAYQNASAGYLTAHQDISNLMPKSESANFYPMEGNPSGFLITHQAISAGEWNDCYNNVNTNSGVWGGSALPVSAGPGIKVNLVDNTLLFSNDETVLWSGTAAPSNFPLTMSEPFSLFEKIEFVWNPRYNGDYGCPTYCTQLGTEKYGATVPAKYTLVGEYANANQIWKEYWYLENDNNGATLSSYKALYWPGTGGTNSASQSNCRLFKVVGINRINGGN